MKMIRMWSIHTVDVATGRVMRTGSGIGKTEEEAIRQHEGFLGKPKKGTKRVSGESRLIVTNQRAERRKWIQSGGLIVCTNCNKWEDRYYCAKNRKSGKSFHTGVVIDKYWKKKRAKEKAEDKKRKEIMKSLNEQAYQMMLDGFETEDGTVMLKLSLPGWDEGEWMFRVGKKRKPKKVKYLSTRKPKFRSGMKKL